MAQDLNMNIKFKNIVSTVTIRCRILESIQDEIRDVSFDFNGSLLEKINNLTLGAYLPKQSLVRLKVDKQNVRFKDKTNRA